MVFLDKILFIIVTYKIKYYEAHSYISLKESFLSSNSKYDEKLNIFIVDNTDIDGWDLSSYLEQDENVKVVYNKLNNPGLSYAYNRGAEFAKSNGFSWIVLLDQDTELPLNFYVEYRKATENDNNTLIKVPITLINKERILSPVKYIFFKSYLYENLDAGIMELKKNSFINTGMLINTDFFIRTGGYNEKIKLDFTDHDFIYKCKKTINNFEVMDVKLIQDFSSETNNQDQAKKRYKFYLRDLKEFKKNKDNRFLLFLNADFFRLVKLTIQYKTIDFIKIRFSL
ncbi:glycosyltransferase [Chryseobacterium manosquense]|uniref:Glycosyltransferase n=1 Tax=Chryseobacterium manosquense TaxID=2754694 RepID=A0A7H1DWG0_9FLAO|nr:glycosyltransferase [Chryseobacterium manosquense]QNS41318.1 glycosyltransferase [Chryseobacterium manosquense]